MTPALKEVFNGIFRRDLEARIEHYDFHYRPEFAGKLKEKFGEFMTQAAEAGITEDGIRAFVQKVNEDDGLRDHVRIGLEKANANARIIFTRWYGPL